jgi:hypothetical protein
MTETDTDRIKDKARLLPLPDAEERTGEDESVLMDAMMAVLSRHDDILDPDGYVDLEKLYQVKDLILPLERRLDDIAQQQKRILDLVAGMGKALELIAGVGDVDGVGPADRGKATPKLRLVDPVGDDA